MCSTAHADESATDCTYDTTNGTGVLESQTSYPSWPSTTGARTTDLQWAFGAGIHQGLGDMGGQFVADLDALENPKPMRQVLPACAKEQRGVPELALNQQSRVLEQLGLVLKGVDSVVEFLGELRQVEGF